MARQDLGKIVSEVTSVNVTVDNNVGVPSAEASISGTLTEKELSINFKNLKGEKGDKPTKGTDYYTDQEKQEFITETNALVVAEGKKQVKELQNQGSLSIERLLKIQKEIEAILQNQEAIGNALALNGKSGPQYDKEIRSIAGGEFDSDLLFLNDAGTKTAGKLYYDKNKSGLFKCIQTTTSTVNSTTNFVDVSSLENANKLENLLSNFSLNFVPDVKNKNIDHIIYNSICFANWNHQCAGTPDDIKSGEFTLLTIAFDKNADENSIPSEDNSIKKNNYSFQLLFSVKGKIYFRVFSWGLQKYLKWNTFQFIE